MDKSMKAAIQFIASQAVQNKPLSAKMSPIKKIAQDFQGHLSELEYLQCLQELSGIPQYKERALYYIDDVAAKTLEMLVIRGETQVYILQSKRHLEISYLLQNKQDDIEKMKNFAFTKQLPDGFGQPQSNVYNAFMDMVDSLSVYPRADFDTNWQKLVTFYGKSTPCGKNPPSTYTPNLSYLLACFEKIVEWEREKRNYANGSC